MTLGDKIKHVLGRDKHTTSLDGSEQTGLGSTGTGAGTGAGNRSHIPGTGPEAYQPMQDSAGGRSTGDYNSSGTGVADTTGTGSTKTGDVPTGAGQGYNTSSSGVGGAAGGSQGVNTGAGEGDISRFSTGYGAGDSDKPGYARDFKAGDPVYHERIEEGNDGSYSADLSASGGKEDWERARELTLQAEREAASAQLSGNKASKELAAAEAAEEAVRKAQQKHREALLEAEKYKAMISDPSDKEGAVSSAMDLYRQKQNALADAQRRMQEAEADLAGKRREAEGLHPKVEKYGQTIPGLENEYEQRLKDRQAAEGERENLLLEARNAEKEHVGLRSSLEGLEAELEEAERLAAIKQQEYIDARNRAQNTASRAAELREKLRAAEATLGGYRHRAEDADAQLPAYREAEQRALRDLENSKGEWYRLRELEDQYVRAFEDAHARHKNLLGSNDPLDKDLRDAQSALSARQDDLDRARSRAQKAEGKYRDLLGLADRHKKYGDSAAAAAAQHGEQYEALRKEAAIHGDRHVELWNEAKNYGEHGSSDATSAVKKLEEKVAELMHKHES